MFGKRGMEFLYHLHLAKSLIHGKYCAVVFFNNDLILRAAESHHIIKTVKRISLVSVPLPSINVHVRVVSNTIVNN